MRILWLLPLLATTLLASDISGKWTGNIEVSDTASGTTINTPVRAEFQQKDSAVSGSIGRREDETTERIRNGKVEGGKLVFEVVSAESNGTIHFTLTVDGNRMEGEMKGAVDTGPISGKVHLTKAE